MFSLLPKGFKQKCIQTIVTTWLYFEIMKLLDRA